MRQISDTEVQRQCSVARSLMALDGRILTDGEYHTAVSMAVAQNREDPEAIDLEIQRLEAGWHQARFR